MVVAGENGLFVEGGGGLLAFHLGVRSVEVTPELLHQPVGFPSAKTVGIQRKRLRREVTK